MPRVRSLAALLLVASMSLGLAGCAGLAAQESHTARPYLVEALQAVRQHDGPTALSQLNQAESWWVSANIRIPNPFIPYDPTALRDIGRARQAVQTGRWSDADYWIRTAIAQPSVVRQG